MLSIKRHAVEHEDIYEIHPSYEVRHQFDEAGNHRLIVSDAVYKAGHREAISAWMGYDQLAICRIHVDKFVGATEYWDGHLPQVFKCVEGLSLGLTQSG